MITFWPHKCELQPVSRQSELDAVLRNGGIPIVVAPGLFVVGDECVVHAVAGIVDVHEHAQAYAADAAKIRAQDDARAWVEGSVHLDAYDRAVVVAAGRACVHAADRSEVIGGKLAQITAVEDVDAVCRDRVTVQANNRARIDASGWARVFAHGDVVVRATARSSVWASDRAVVWADASVSVDCEGGPVSLRRRAPGTTLASG